MKVSLRLDNNKIREMKTAKELLMEYWESFPTPAKAAALFASDGVLELPSLESMHVPPRAKGPEAIEKFIGSLMSLIPDWKFTNKRIFMEYGNQVFAEYEIHVITGHTKRQYDQLFFGRLVAENGKIKLLREALNVVKAAQAMLKNGIDDIPKS
jgi:hypothetical protein